MVLAAQLVIGEQSPFRVKDLENLANVDVHF
jgi:hypothetical protein